MNDKHIIRKALPQITLESTLTSKAFYLKNGFEDKGEIERVKLSDVFRWPKISKPLTNILHASKMK